MNPWLIGAAIGALFLWQRSQQPQQLAGPGMRYFDGGSPQSGGAALMGFANMGSSTAELVGGQANAAVSMSLGTMVDALGDAVAEGAPGTEAQAVFVSNAPGSVSQLAQYAGQWTELIIRGINSPNLAEARRQRAIAAAQQLGLVRGSL